jgi:hypothetical protein
MEVGSWGDLYLWRFSIEFDLFQAIYRRLFAMRDGSLTDGSLTVTNNGILLLPKCRGQPTRLILQPKGVKIRG